MRFVQLFRGVVVTAFVAFLAACDTGTEPELQPEGWQITLAVINQAGVRVSVGQEVNPEDEFNFGLGRYIPQGYAVATEIGANERLAFGIDLGERFARWAAPTVDVRSEAVFAGRFGMRPVKQPPITLEGPGVVVNVAGVLYTCYIEDGCYPQRGARVFAGQVPTTRTDSKFQAVYAFPNPQGQYNLRSAYTWSVGCARDGEYIDLQGQGFTTELRNVWPEDAGVAYYGDPYLRITCHKLARPAMSRTFSVAPISG